MLKLTAVLIAVAWAVMPNCLLARTPETVAVIGTGDVGDSVGPKLGSMGFRVVYGSRDPSRKSVQSLVSLTGHDASAAIPLKAAQRASIVVLAVPWPAMEKVAQSLGNLDGKILVDVSTPTRQAEDGYLESSVETSSAEMIQTWNPRAKVVKTLLAGAYVIDDPASILAALIIKSGRESVVPVTD